MTVRVLIDDVGMPLHLSLDQLAAAQHEHPLRHVPAHAHSRPTALFQPPQPPQDPRRRWHARLHRRHEHPPRPPVRARRSHPDSATCTSASKARSSSHLSRNLRLRLGVRDRRAARRTRLVPAHRARRPVALPRHRRRPRFRLRQDRPHDSRRDRLRRHSIDIVTPYFLPEQPLITALNVAAMRGVAVQHHPAGEEQPASSSSGPARPSSGRCCSAAAASGSLRRRSTTRS